MQFFAYMHRHDNEQFGLLEAVDFKNAREHLGRSFSIVECDIDGVEWAESICHRDKRRAIVERVMANDKMGKGRLKSGEKSQRGT